MQVTDTEILLPFKNSPQNSPLSSREMISYLGIGGSAMLSIGIVWLIADWGHIPEILLPILLIGFAILCLLCSMMLWQNERHFIRIDREGFCFTQLFGGTQVPTMVAWDEISSLGPYNTVIFGQSIISLGIFPQDSEAIIARIVAQNSRTFLSRLTVQINIYFHRRSNFLTPLHIPTGILPISIDELIAMIQERFAVELHEHHITVRTTKI
ncbi:hypothetical protein [Ktedonobacter racemifer]|uniref:Uncharacterized protein n=1 Tax=Ktedonobacter racemifer DSM 44963 TaxID=485913 RepID=D6TN51_KTERA|nr:hypothetical protein [Ktedonobacter racemifer]EFH87201.1 hypothetical protein Krac_8529 [Ktedonobacter racemifer DSM 44963]